MALPVFLSRAHVELRWCLWPRRCELSGQRLWLTTAYRARATWTGPGTSVAEEKWFSSAEYLLMRLKNG